MKRSQERRLLERVAAGEVCGEDLGLGLRRYWYLNQWGRSILHLKTIRPLILCGHVLEEAGPESTFVARLTERGRKRLAELGGKTREEA